LSLFTHVRKELSLCFRVCVNGIQLATTRDVEGQADMNWGNTDFCGGS
jgi:hypothetical protein